MKDFRRCYELFDQIADGYLIGILAQMCNWEDGKSIADTFDETLDIEDKIRALAKRLVNFNEVDNVRKSPAAERDKLSENMILYLQHALIMRNFRHAMRNGDIGRLLLSFRYVTLWFQASKQYNYANETIHLTACLEKIWSPEFKEYILNHSLISIMGKPDGFWALDETNEHVVWQVKKMMVHNATPATDQHLRETISPQVMYYLSVKMKMAEESDMTASTFDYHHQQVETSADVDQIAKDCLRQNVFEVVPGRESKEVPDLFITGLNKLCTTKSLTEYKSKVSAMGIRGIVELQTRSENETRPDEELDDEDELQIGTGSIIVGEDDHEDMVGFIGRAIRAGKK